MFKNIKIKTFTDSEKTKWEWTVGQNKNNIIFIENTF